jgi:hypothetical protein
MLSTRGRGILSNKLGPLELGYPPNSVTPPNRPHHFGSYLHSTKSNRLFALICYLVYRLRAFYLAHFKALILAALPLF